MNKATKNRGTGMTGKSKKGGKAKASPSHIAPSSDLNLKTAEEKWERAGIGDSFIFASVMMQNKDLLLELLQLTLPELQIVSIVDNDDEVTIKVTHDSHGVRLDITVVDSKHRFFNIEMQLRDEQNISRRIRFYGSTLGQTLLKPGEDYSRLPDTIVLFITKFDPFGKGRYRYTFRNICLEEDDDRLELGDGTTKVILSAIGTGKAKNDIISPQLIGFLQLVLGAELKEDASFAYARRVQEKVKAAKRSSRLWREYMNWEMHLLVANNKGVANGELLTFIRLILAKLAKGKPENIIADEIEGSIDFVHQISSLSVGMSNPTPESILDAYKTLQMEGKAIPPACGQLN